MLLTERETQEGLLVSVCDPDVLGQTFEDGPVSLTVEESFYAEGAEEADEDRVVGALARASVANIVGTRAVSLAVENGFVDESTVLNLDGTRHAQLLRM
ncbi:DUF424 domain-containing protein [Halomarina litorea]|uniref:DUF424 domain-containing protein n=1 Tax=Halomarina litorea TaxID=2961595 RepID=UPI0020C32601|nr:DUF424 domain-containing protein [Halomarina sp. BCD28]